MPQRPAFRNPAPRLPGVIQYLPADVIFLNALKPWAKKHWVKKFGTVADRNQCANIQTYMLVQLRAIQNNYCAFCGVDLDLVHEVHREHISPQYKSPNYIFEPENLVAACDMCNSAKGTKLTMTTGTGTYSTEQFKILHPHKDDFSAQLSCDVQNKGLVFKIIGNQPVKAQETIDCVGLAKPHLMTLRGSIIINKELASTGWLNGLVLGVLKWRRKRNG